MKLKKHKNKMLVKFMKADVNNFTSNAGIKIRRRFAGILKKILIVATKEKIIVENYPKLELGTSYIFAATHGFSNDIIACLATIDRSAYLLMGSTNQVEYNKLMYFAWFNGFIYVDRTNSDSRKSSLDKMERVIRSGSSILLFPEGAFNNTENKLCNRLFAGPYLLAKRTGAKVVPIAPFYEYGSDTIYMKYGEPIDMCSHENKDEAIRLLRDKFSTMVYENIESHASSLVRRNLAGDIRMKFMEERRKEYLKNSWTRDVWEEELTVYKDKKCPTPEDVRKTLLPIQINANNAKWLLPILQEAQEDLKYDFKTCMQRTWDKE